MLYANEHQETRPAAYSAADADGDPFVDAAAKQARLESPEEMARRSSASVPSSLFLLLRTQQIGSEVFVTPSSDAEKDNYGGGAVTLDQRTQATSLGRQYQNFEDGRAVAASRKALAFTKTGGGALTLSGNNTYTGGTTVTDGTLRANPGQAIGSLAAADAGSGPEQEWARHPGHRRWQESDHRHVRYPRRQQRRDTQPF